MAELKTKETNADVVDFLNEIDNEQKREDCFVLLDLFSEITNEKPVMWGDSMIGFGKYHYKYASGREGNWFLTGFSPRKQNITIYIMSGFKPHDDILQDFGKYKTSSSCLYIKKLEDIDLEKLRILITASVNNMKKEYS